MGALTKTIFVILLIVFIVNTLPNAYDSGREWALDKLPNNSITNTIGDWADLTNFECENSQQCIDKFRIDGLVCLNNKCEVGENVGIY